MLKRTDILICFVIQTILTLFQTKHVIKRAKQYNSRNLLLLLFLAVFASIVSVFQSKVIIKKTTKNIKRTE